MPEPLTVIPSLKLTPWTKVPKFSSFTEVSCFAPSTPKTVKPVGMARTSNCSRNSRTGVRGLVFLFQRLIFMLEIPGNKTSRVGFFRSSHNPSPFRVKPDFNPDFLVEAKLQSEFLVAALSGVFLKAGLGRHALGFALRKLMDCRLPN